jgi:hypothetical protein
VRSSCKRKIPSVEPALTPEHFFAMRTLKSSAFLGAPKWGRGGIGLEIMVQGRARKTRVQSADASQTTFVGQVKRLVLVVVKAQVLFDIPIKKRQRQRGR